MRMQKLVLDLSVAQILLEKINKLFLSKKFGFIILTRSVQTVERVALGLASFNAACFIQGTVINSRNHPTLLKAYQIMSHCSVHE